MSIYVLVHGAGHGRWCWERTEADLARSGQRSLSIELPLTSLEEDADAVRKGLDALDESAILVGHSYGGLVISKAAGGRNDVKQLVYLAAVLVGADEGILDLVGDTAPSSLHERLEYTSDGSMMTITPEAAIDCLYNDTPIELARAASLRMRPTATSGMVTGPGAEPWRSIPTSYIVCERVEPSILNCNG